jgi:predicted unusual protein kinase regulating ubiquinone biosynthesis (AarF/ABC1/UbiB family)
VARPPSAFYLLAVSRADDGTKPAEPPAELAKIPEGGLSRGLKLGSALVGAWGRAAARRLVGANDTESKAGANLAATLGEMKGLSMKLGQMLSYVDMQVPEDWRHALARLQHQSPAMPRNTVFQVIEEDLGRAPDVLFAAWDEKPFAAASIGQVHRARLPNGTEVAVKVRYPTIERVVQQDLGNLELLRRFGSLLMPELDSAEVMAELEERFLEECDYRKEAESQTMFRQFFDGTEGVVIPRVHHDHSGHHVLTTDLIDGRPFGDFIRLASQGDRNQAARLIHNFAFSSIYQLGALNCDPHPGNYLFMPGRVAFLDFGCVRRFSEPLTAAWKMMIRSALERDHAAFRDAVVSIGFAKNDGTFDFDAHYRQYLHLIRPWLTAETGTLTRDLVVRSYRAFFLANPNRTRLKMPRELVFANRLQWGLYSVLADLEATCPYRDEILDVLYAPGEPRPAPFTDEELRRFALSPERRP